MSKNLTKKQTELAVHQAIERFLELREDSGYDNTPDDILIYTIVESILEWNEDINEHLEFDHKDVRTLTNIVKSKLKKVKLID